MPELVPPALPPDVLSRLVQPSPSRDGITLRPWLAGDAAAVAAAYDDSAIQQWHGRSMTVPEAEAWVRAWPSRWSSGADASWAAVRGGALVGRMSFKHVVPEAASAEAAYWVVPEARGRGVAVVALQLASEFMLSIGFERLELVHSVANGSSCRVAVKADYLLEGVKRRSGLHADGWHDMHLHARVAGSTR
jgi:RimJ/RimL family protein N-acetyltransferase